MSGKSPYKEFKSNQSYHGSSMLYGSTPKPLPQERKEHLPNLGISQISHEEYNNGTFSLTLTIAAEWRIKRLGFISSTVDYMNTVRQEERPKLELLEIAVTPMNKDGQVTISSENLNDLSDLLQNLEERALVSKELAASALSSLKEKAPKDAGCKAG